MDNLFATHPAPENRIAALVEMARRRADRPPRVQRAAVPRVGSGAGAANRSHGPWG
jgi:hypothetical protein